MAKIVRVYTNDPNPGPKGREFRFGNPDWFDSVKKDVAKVVVIGNYPHIVESYKNLGIPVENPDHFDPEIHGFTKQEMEAPSAPQVNPEPKPSDPVENAGQVEIPAEWEKMPWVAEKPEDSIRTLAEKFTKEPVINRGQAQKIVREELARRGKSPTEPQG